MRHGKLKHSNKMRQQVLWKNDLVETLLCLLFIGPNIHVLKLHILFILFLDYIDNDWLWRQNSPNLAGKIAFRRLCTPRHFFLCTSCREYLCKNNAV